MSQSLQVVNQKVQFSRQHEISHQIKDNLPLQILLGLYLVIQTVKLNRRIDKQTNLADDRPLDILQLQLRCRIYLLVVIRLLAQELHIPLGKRRLEFINACSDWVLFV